MYLLRTAGKNSGKSGRLNRNDCNILCYRHMHSCNFRISLYIDILISNLLLYKYIYIYKYRKYISMRSGKHSHSIIFLLIVSTQQTQTLNIYWFNVGLDAACPTLNHHWFNVVLAGLTSQQNIYVILTLVYVGPMSVTRSIIG